MLFASHSHCLPDFHNQNTKSSVNGMLRFFKDSCGFKTTGHAFISCCPFLGPRQSLMLAKTYAFCASGLDTSRKLYWIPLKLKLYAPLPAAILCRWISLDVCVLLCLHCNLVWWIVLPQVLQMCRWNISQRNSSHQHSGHASSEHEAEKLQFNINSDDIPVDTNILYTPRSCSTIYWGPPWTKVVFSALKAHHKERKLKCYSKFTIV